MSIPEIIAIEILEKKDIADYPKYLKNALALELIEVNELSPGIVENEEQIVRIIYDPFHIDKGTGELLATAFDDLLSKDGKPAIGLSINRLKYITLDEVSKKAKTMAAEISLIRTARSYYGYTTLEVSKLRETVNGDKLFVVLDTAKEDDISHGDVHCVVNRNILQLNTKPFKMLVRNRLLELFVTGFKKIA